METLMQNNNTKTILIVDDELAILEFVEESLNIAGYNTMAASNGNQALQLVEQQDVAIDLLLTDITMPYMNGIDLAEWFASLYPEVKIVFMSGFFIQPEELTILPKKEFAFMQKPFQPDTLLALLETTLNKPVETNQDFIAGPPKKKKNSFSQEKLIEMAMNNSSRERKSEGL